MAAVLAKVLNFKHIFQKDILFFLKKTIFHKSRRNILMATNPNRLYMIYMILGQNPPRQNPPGQNLPTKTPPGQNPPGQNPPGQNPPDKTPRTKPPLDKTPRQTNSNSILNYYYYYRISLQTLQMMLSSVNDPIIL